MTAIRQSLRSITIQGLEALVRIRLVLIGIVTVGLGILFGYLIDSPEAGGLITSIVGTIVVLVIIINKPLNGLLLWLFFMVFIETRVKIPMGAGIPDLSFSRFTIAFLATSMLAMAAVDKFRFARISLADVCILATPIGIMIAAPQSVDPNPKSVIQTAISMHFTPLVIYFFAKNLVKNRSDLHKVFLMIAILGFVAGVYAVYEHATGNVLFVSETKRGAKLIRSSGIRMIRGLMGSTGNMGRALAATIPVTFYLFLERKKNDIGRVLLIVMLIAQFYGIYLAMARSPWYALLLALFIMQLFYPKFRRLFYVIVFVATIALWATWDQVVESDAADRVDDKVSTLEGREVRWQAGYNMWLAKPIRGWGFGRYKEESGRFRTDGESRNIAAIENDYLYILVGSGLIGFLPYLTFLLAPLVNSLRLFFKARAPDWSGFIRPETLSVYWAVILCLAITSYSAIQTQAVIKLMTFAVAGAVVGTHEHLLRDLTQKAVHVIQGDDNSQTQRNANY
jgi:O-antigen ligase